MSSIFIQSILWNLRRADMAMQDYLTRRKNETNSNSKLLVSVYWWLWKLVVVNTCEVKQRHFSGPSLSFLFLQSQVWKIKVIWTSSIKATALSEQFAWEYIRRTVESIYPFKLVWETSVNTLLWSRSNPNLLVFYSICSSVISSSPHSSFSSVSSLYSHFTHFMSVQQSY